MNTPGFFALAGDRPSPAEAFDKRTLRTTCEDDRTIESGIRCMNSNEAVLMSPLCKKLLQERRLRVGSFASVKVWVIIGSGGAHTQNHSFTTVQITTLAPGCPTSKTCEKHPS